VDVKIRKIVTGMEEISHDGGPRLDEPVRKGFIGAVIENPFAGRYVDEIAPFMEDLKPLGLEMSRRLVDLLAEGDPGRIEAYGKGSIIGAGGEIEHSAFWHVPGGYAMREILGEALAIVPSATKVGTLGTRLDVPVHHINAAYVRSHFDAMEVGVADAPRAHEIVFFLVMTTGGRPHARMGGLTVAEIARQDGLR
jgi:hypothetical protein